MHGSKRLAAWRVRVGRSQTDCAKEIGVRQPTWSEWESGGKNPQITHAVAIERLATDPETGTSEVPVASWAESTESENVSQTGTDGR